MSQTPVTLNVEKEILDMQGPIVALIAGIKAKKTPIQLAEDELAALIPVVVEAVQIPNDVVTDPSGSADAAYLLGKAILAAVKA